MKKTFLLRDLRVYIDLTYGNRAALHEIVTLRPRVRDV